MVVFLMLRYFSVDELGDFQVVTKPIFTYMLMLFVFPICRFILPELSKLINEKNIDEIKSLKKWTFRYAFIVSGSFLVVALLFSDNIIEGLFPIEYINASLMIKHLAFFFIFLILNAFQLAFIKASGAFLSALFIRLFGIVVLVATFYLIFNFYSKSVISVIIALVSSHISMFTVSFFLERKIFTKLKKESN